MLFASGNFVEYGFTISHVELRLYEERIDENLGTFSLITVFVNTDKGSIELLYDEGFRGSDALNRIARFLKSDLGLSGLILRSVIALNTHVSNSDT